MLRVVAEVEFNGVERMVQTSQDIPPNSTLIWSLLIRFLRRRGEARMKQK